MDKQIDVDHLCIRDPPVCTDLHGVLIGADAIPVFLLLVQLATFLHPLIKLQPVLRQRIGWALDIQRMLTVMATGRLRCDCAAVAVQRAQLHHVVDQTDQRFALLVLFLQFDQLPLELLESRQVLGACVAVASANAVLRYSNDG